MRGLTSWAAGAMALVAVAACGRPTTQQAAADPPGQPGATPTYSGYGTPPAPPSPPPPPEQLAAAQKALAACQQTAAAPNAQAVGPCMWDHGWTDKMTLDCHYGNDPSNAACYLPRR